MKRNRHIDDFITLTVMQKVIFLSKEELHPRYGYAAPFSGTVFVRRDLPRCVREFVLVHELYHPQDRTHWWVRREIKANIVGALRHPLGFIICILMSFAPYRLSYYWKRMIGDDE